MKEDRMEIIANVTRALFSYVIALAAFSLTAKARAFDMALAANQCGEHSLSVENLVFLGHCAACWCNGALGALVGWFGSGILRRPLRLKALKLRARQK